MVEKRRVSFPLTDTLRINIITNLGFWQDVYSEMGGLLRSGAALTTGDIDALLRQYGLSEVISRIHTRSRTWNTTTLDRLNKQEGIAVKQVEYRGRIIWLDSSLPFENTYIDDVIKKIDADLEKAKRLHQELSPPIDPAIE